MDQKQAMTSAVVILFAIAVFNILPIGGLFVCPWCDKGMQNRLLDCVYVEFVSRPELMEMPVPEIDDIKWRVSSESDSMIGLSYADKKVKMDKIFMDTIADAMKRNNFQHNHEVINVVSDIAGRCYSSVTGYDPRVVTRDVKRMIKENIKEKEDPFEKDTNPLPDSGMPYPANQNQQNNFQASQPQFQPSLVPANPATSYQPNTANNFPLQIQPAVNGNVYNNNPALQSNLPLKNGPYTPPVSPPANSFNNPSSVNNTPFNPPASPPVNPSNNPTFANNGAGPSDNSRNQAPFDSSSGDSLKNDDESQSNKDSLDNAAFTSTTSSPKISSPPQDSRPSNMDLLDNSYKTTLPPIADASNTETTESDKSEDEEACAEKFKIALYEKLMNDVRFYSFFGKLPVSTTNPAVPRIMNHVFKQYDIEEHYSEFSTFWNFESKKLNKESKAEDWDEVISKICKIIFSRNNLLKEDCEETGRKIADYFLDELPGDQSASSTENPNQNDGNGKATTESIANPTFISTTIAPVENNASSDNSTKPENLSIPELKSKLANIFKHGGSTEQDSGKVPFSELLTAFEVQQYLGTLHEAANKCKSPSGFDFKKFLGTMTNVSELIQKNHPDWSHDRCQKEMYSATVAVLTKELQDSLSSKNNAKDKSASNQPDATGDSSDSQNLNSSAQPSAPNDYDIPSDDLANPGAGPDYDKDSAPPPQLDFSNYGNNPDGPGPVNIPPFRNPPAAGNWNAGLTKPLNFPPGPVNTNNWNFNNGNLQNPPLPANQPYEPNFGSQNYGNKFSQPSAQNYPSQDYPAIPPANKNTEPDSGLQPSPVISNTGLQQSPNFAPKSGVLNSSNGNFGNNRFQAENRGLNAGPPNTALLNGNSQNFQPQLHQDYNRGIPATGRAIQNGNNQQQFNPNYNSRFPANGPANPQW